ncbi:ROK family protein [Microlunatus sp. Gsoil 973]|uniref:ROK family protein n=1 Tax=Microlunatus sp. Gsoil 973 TaxID=2672569 RepID=UPI0012B450BF|nr:ROK family protein [Microlunatus sp. Gsoil 973]QGN34069.1 ROK family protein [Microlunatus sp. Gsoil 973]
MTAESPALGVDLGGSKIAVGLVDPGGRVLRRSVAPTPATEGRDAILATIRRLADEARADRPIVGIGIGSGGVIAGGVVTAGTGLLTGWVGTDLVGHFTRVFRGLGPQLVVTALNDVHAHGVGEAWCGAGAGRDHVLVVAAGTGLGGAVIEHGRPMTGAHGLAGHFGHIASPAAVGLPCSCGATGHLEAISSGYGIVQLYRSIGGDPTVTEAREVAGRSGFDGYADRAMQKSADALGAAVGDLVNIVDPDVVIISGGVAGAGTLWWNTLRAAAASAALPLVAETPIVPAQLGADAGIIGAARCTRDAVAAR